MAIKIKRVYETVDRADGKRILVDRLWPRGFTKERAAVDHWVKELAPSDTLRPWYGHEPDKWTEFKRRYFAELGERPEEVKRLLELVGTDEVTFVFSSREMERNHAAALKEYIETLLSATDR